MGCTSFCETCRLEGFRETGELPIPPIPSTVQTIFIGHLKQRKVPPSTTYSFCLKRMRYYPGFCEKNHFPPTQGAVLTTSFASWGKKKPSPDQQQQARHAISLFCKLLQPKTHGTFVRPPQGRITTGNPHVITASPANSTPKQVPDASEADLATQIPSEPPRSLLSLPRRLPLTQRGSWKAKYARLTDEVKLRHHSPKILRTYTHWVRHYQTFTRSQDPKALSTEHIKAFLSFIAVEQKVSATLHSAPSRGCPATPGPTLSSASWAWPTSFSPESPC
jgi:Phage integrase, N-terminal SAM-like domain